MVFIEPLLGDWHWVNHYMCESQFSIKLSCCALKDQRFYISDFWNILHGTPLAVQWVRLFASTGRAKGLNPAQAIKILHAEQHGQKELHIIKYSIFLLMPILNI